MKHLAVALVMLSCLATVSADAVPLDDGDDRADIRRIEAYLNDITTLRSRTLQTSSDGAYAYGTLYVSRPGHLRFEYDDPSPILLVADGIFLVYVDHELEQISRLPINSTPVGILLEDEILLTADHEIVALERATGTIAVTLTMKDDPDQGSIRFLFADRPLALKSWRIRDARGVEVTVSLLSFERGVDLEPALFRVDPYLFEQPDHR